MVALNAWWDGDPAQRYWLEITDRDDVGADLRAPKVADNSSTKWSYDLCSLVEVGDRVLHYMKRAPGQPSIVGWSECTGPAFTVPDYSWQARGTAGRARGVPTVGPGWVVPLGGMKKFTSPTTRSRLNSLRPEVLALRKELEAKVDGSTYFPFYDYGGREIRTQQGYLVKWPVELFELLPELKPAMVGLTPDLDDEVSEDARPPKARVPKGKVSRAQDPVLRAALERRSLDVARDYYKSKGATEHDIKELGKPYDLIVQLDGAERHVEVKGSSQEIATVELTRNEVKHSGSCPTCDLIVVDKIEWSRVGQDVSTSGGRLRIWTSWKPEATSLEPTKYAYNLPPDSS